MAVIDVTGFDWKNNRSEHKASDTLVENHGNISITATAGGYVVVEQGTGRLIASAACPGDHDPLTNLQRGRTRLQEAQK